MPESQRDLRRKRKIITDIRQITHAMKLVSAAKLKRTLARRETAQLYWDQLGETMAVLGQRVGAEVEHPYLERRPVERVGMLVIGGDKGLCGAFNSSIVAAAAEAECARGKQVVVATVGARTGDLARRAGLESAERFPAFQEKDGWRDALAISQHLEGLYLTKAVDRVCVTYARFISRVSHEPAVETLLPLEAPEQTDEWRERYIFEPDSVELLRDLLPRYVRAWVYRMLLEGAASEHSARLMAMTAATDNADDMMEQFTRQINRARQQEVTRELLDVVSGADALAQEA